MWQPAEVKLVDVGLEHLDDIGVACQQRGRAGIHGLVRRAPEADGIDAGTGKVVLEHQPRRPVLGGDRDTQIEQVLEAKRVVRDAADQDEGIAGDDLCEADQLAGGVGLVVRHYPHRAAQETSAAPWSSMVPVWLADGEVMRSMSTPAWAKCPRASAK